MPVLNGEVAYEGIMGSNWEDVQRLMFWSCMLSGAAGHTYGASGSWQVNTEAQPFGLSPRGQSWGGLPPARLEAASLGETAAGKIFLVAIQTPPRMD